MEPTGKQTYQAVLKIKSFRILWINEILVQLSYNMVNFALIVRVFTLTGRNTASSLFVLAAAIPALCFGVFTGVLADVYDKRKILLFTDFAIGVCFLSFLFAQSYVALILLLALILNITFQFFIPAEAATIPIIVPKKLLITANALFYFVLTICMVIGQSIAGPIVTHFGYSYIFIVAAGAMFVGFFLRGALPSLPSENPTKLRYKKGEFNALMKTSLELAVEGLGFIRQHIRVLIPVIILVLVQLIAYTLVALGPGFMEQVLHVQAVDASQVLLFPLGLGLVLGALLVGRVGERLPHRYAIVSGIGLSSLAILGFGIGPLLFQSARIISFTHRGTVPFIDDLNVSLFVAGCAVVLGIATALMVVPSQTILQNATNVSIRGRIFSIVEALKAIVAVLPVLLVGTLADLFGIIPIMITIGALLLIVAVVSARFMQFEERLAATLTKLKISDL